MIIGRSHAPYVFAVGARQFAVRPRWGEPVAAVAVETGICQATLFRWKRQALVDAGAVEGTPSVELTSWLPLTSALRSSKRSWP